ncbi:MAG: HlyD family secretion protein [Armatimonadota bacterium]
MRRNPRRRRLILLAVIGAIVIAGLAIYYVLAGRPSEYLTASGIIEATEVTVSSKITARVIAVYASESDTVNKEQVLVRLYDQDLRQQVAQAKAMVNAASAQLAEALAGARPETIRQARANVAQAEAATAGARRSLALAEQQLADSRELEARLETARTNYRQAQAALSRAQALSTQASEDLRRAQELFARGAIAASQLDAARANADSAQAEVSSASSALSGARRNLTIAEQQYSERLAERQQVTAARTQYETAQEQLAAARARLEELLAGTRPEEVARLRAQVAQAQAALAQAQTNLSNATVESPIKGTVITRAVEPGDLATVGSTLMVLADLSTVKLTIYVEETVYGRIRLGQPAQVTVDSYPDEVFSGEVTRIAEQAEFTPREIQTEEQRAKLVFAVEITLPNPDGLLKPGMPADATLRLLPG